MREALEPRPATAEALACVDEAVRSGHGYKRGLERALLALEEESADALMLLLKESRGAWALLLEQAGGRALFVGNALSGTVPALTQLGFAVTLAESCVARSRFALVRGEAHSPGRQRAVLVEGAPRLPFADRVFDLVVQEGTWPGGATEPGRAFDELARVSRGEVVLCTDNRLAYKRSTGLRGQYHVPGPLEYVRGVARPGHGERTLRGYRRLFANRGVAPRAFALYPHAAEFSHVVGLDGAGPGLTIGPRERRNRAKVLARALGLFPVLTPSFAILGSRRGSGSTRLGRVLTALAERLDEPRPDAELVVATRSNCCLVHTAVRGAPPGEPAGRWTLHVPLSPKKQEAVERNHRFLGLVCAHAPEVPVPEPLFFGEIEGARLACERRLGGLTAPHLTGRRAPTRRMFLDAARDGARLVRERVVLDEALLEALVDRRFRVVSEHAAVASTRARLERMRAEVRERLLGLDAPLAICHADLRSKHVQVRPDGSVLGYLDWGASEEHFFAWIDLVHLVAHQRKQETGCSPARTWQLVRERDELREHEHEALDLGARLAGVSAELRAALEQMYPVLVASMSELCWDYSRPRWIHRHFGL